MFPGTYFHHKMTEPMSSHQKQFSIKSGCSMKYFILTTLFSVLLSTAVNAGERVDETLKVSGDVTVEIEHQNGKVKIEGWDRDEVQVVGELDDKAEEFIFEERRGRVLIEVKMRKNKNWSSSKKGDDLDIKVPFKSLVRYSGVNADADISNLKQGLQANTVNGKIDARDIEGRIALESVNGDLDGRDLIGDLTLETVNGRIRDRNSSGSELFLGSVNGDIESSSAIKEVSIETVNGGIELELGEVEELRMSTVNGTIEVAMHLLEQGRVEGSTVSGEIEMAFQNGVSAKFDIQAHAGGRIVNRLSDHKVEKAKYGPSRWLEFELEGGKGRVDLSTVSGRIELDTRKN